MGQIRYRAKKNLMIYNYTYVPSYIYVPRIHHVSAESLFVYQLIKILNEFNNSVIIKLKERSYSFPDFSNYVTLKSINNYSDQKICNTPDCYACKRN